MSISIIFIHVKLIHVKLGFQFSYKLQYIEEYTNVNINLSNINKFILTFVS